MMNKFCKVAEVLEWMLQSRKNPKFQHYVILYVTRDY